MEVTDVQFEKIAQLSLTHLNTEAERITRHTLCADCRFKERDCFCKTAKVVTGYTLAEIVAVVARLN